jgi:transcriptional regulator NrdR family protein
MKPTKYPRIAAPRRAPHQRCPACGSTGSKPVSLEVRSKRLVQDGVSYFRRHRVCRSCGRKYPTAEVPMSVLRELHRLRETVRNIRYQLDMHEPPPRADAP